MYKKFSKTMAVVATVAMLSMSGPAFAGQMGDDIADDFRGAPMPVTFLMGVGGFVVAVVATIPTALTNYRKVDDLYSNLSIGFFRAMVSTPYEN